MKNDKWHLVVERDGREGHCSCGKDVSLVRVTIIHPGSRVTKEETSACMECFMEGECLIQSRFLTALGIPLGEIGFVAELVEKKPEDDINAPVICSCGAEGHLPTQLVPPGYLYQCSNCKRKYTRLFKVEK